MQIRGSIALSALLPISLVTIGVGLGLRVGLSTNQAHVTIAVDAGTPDTGAPDTGAPDTGAPDTGAPDTGAPDTGWPMAPNNALYVAANPHAVGSDLAELDGLTKMTWVAAFLHDSTVTDTEHLFGKSDFSTQNSWMIVRQNDGSLRFYTPSSVSDTTVYTTLGQSTVTSPGTFAKSDWSIAACRYDGTAASAADRVECAINGIITTGSANESTPTALPSSTATFKIGSVGSNPWDRAVAAVAIWIGEAATDSELKTITAGWTDWTTATSFGRPAHVWLNGNNANDTTSSIKDVGDSANLMDLTPSSGTFVFDDYGMLPARLAILAGTSPNVLERETWDHCYWGSGVSGATWTAKCGGANLSAVGSNATTGLSTTGLSNLPTGLANAAVKPFAGGSHEYSGAATQNEWDDAEVTIRMIVKPVFVSSTTDRVFQFGVTGSDTTTGLFKLVPTNSDIDHTMTFASTYAGSVQNWSSTWTLVDVNHVKSHPLFAVSHMTVFVNGAVRHSDQDTAANTITAGAGTMILLEAASYEVLAWQMRDGYTTHAQHIQDGRRLGVIAE